MKVFDPSEDFKTFSANQWKELHRRAVVERNAQLKDQPSKARLERKLVKLEDRWRELSGIKRTSIRNWKSNDEIKQQQSEYDTIKHAKSKEMLRNANGLK